MADRSERRQKSVRYRLAKWAFLWRLFWIGMNKLLIKRCIGEKVDHGLINRDPIRYADFVTNERGERLSVKLLSHSVPYRTMSPYLGLHLNIFKRSAAFSACRPCYLARRVVQASFNDPVTRAMLTKWAETFFGCGLSQALRSMPPSGRQICCAAWRTIKDGGKFRRFGNRAVIS